MPRITRARMTAEAEHLANTAAPRADAAAADGEQFAANPANSDSTRQCATTAAKIARRTAADYRSMAATLRAGEIPDGFSFD
ncbi:hypothetical protein ABZ705_27000 [Streptomyces sp. NPDC006984]|uniref:hypothetical protein n=1 Tax=Streptomyces sp. NPDC006984 TaxID=3155463 RepID=UPI0033DAB584